MTETLLEHRAHRPRPAASRVTRRRIRFAASATRVIVTFAILMLLVFPVLWMVITALRPAADVASPTLPEWSDLTLDGFAQLADVGFGQYLLNSFSIAIASSAISATFALFAAYALSRRRFRGRRVLMFGIVLTQLLPFVMLVTPLYVIFSSLGLLDTYHGIVLAYVAITLPFSIFMLLGYVDSIPISLDEAAELDGCGVFTTLFRIVLPVAWPGVAAVAIYSFTIAWEEYLLASVLLVDPGKRTLPVALAGLFGEFTTQWDIVMSAAVVATIPTLVVFIILQRRLVADLTGGALK